MDNKTVFDLMEVIFGNEETVGRPFEFTEDGDGNFVEAIKVITSCPNCGHGQEVMIISDKRPIPASCDNCGLGENYLDAEISVESKVIIDDIDVNMQNVEHDPEEVAKMMMALANSESRTDSIKGNSGSIDIDTTDEVEILVSSCAFVDPIELGKFEVEEI